MLTNEGTNKTMTTNDLTTATGFDQAASRD